MPPGRRRTSDARAAVFRYCNGDGTLDFSDNEDNNETEEGVWHCNTCPLVLSEPNEIRVLIPCGHLFCGECAEGLAKCPLKSCIKKVNKIVTPKIQEGESVDKEAEEEKEQAERLVILDKLRKLEDEQSDLKKKIGSQDSKLTTRIALNKEILQQNNIRKRGLDKNINVVETKIKLARFMSTIVNSTKTFPVNNKGDKCKAYYSLAAHTSGQFYREEMNKIDQEVSTESLRLRTANQERQTLNTAINELVGSKIKQDDDPELWGRFEALASNTSNAFESNLPTKSTGNSGFRNVTAKRKVITLT